ncbi:MAG: thioredoxin domain-containing protein [Kiritimatiellia bacterium]
MMARNADALEGGAGRVRAVPTNRLAGSISPYLQQHAGNPVNWHPWGEEAFALARRENKPIFLSVGYSTCHWCHVMNRESFENEEIASVLNRYFIPIKVDREERPDVDRVYMTFVTATTGSGGWPLSVWLTPELKPFAGGTYYPPDDRWGRPGFRSVLEQIAAAWEKDQAGIVDAGQRVVEQLRRASAAKYTASLDLDDGLLHQTYRNIKASYEPRFGGFGGAPKFPRPSAPGFLLRYHARAGAPDALSMTLHTLRRMALGGIYDQIGGGFHRYAVDARWHVPHFEKMLYDQALLVPVYLDAYQITGDVFYADVVRDVLAYVLAVLRGSEGQFFSAEDADSALPDTPGQHAEGAFYVWSAAELDTVLGDDASWMRRYFGVEETGNVVDDPHAEFTGRNVLYVASTLDDLAVELAVSADEWQERFVALRGRLQEHRARRPRPHRDDKAITGWNGLMISAFARAWQVLGDAAYRDAALGAIGFIRRELYDAGTGALARLHREGEVSGAGFLEDYAFLIQALLDTYEAVFDTQYLAWAMTLQAKQDALFRDHEGGGYFDTVADDPEILLRMKDDHDGALPSGNSVSAMNLLRLAEMTGNAAYREAAEETVKAFGRSLAQVPHAMPAMMSAVDFMLGKPRQILIAGAPADEDSQALLRVVHQHYLPNRILMLTQCAGKGDPSAIQPFLGSLAKLEDRATAYVCVDHVCDLPVNTVAALEEVLRQ